MKKLLVACCLMGLSSLSFAINRSSPANGCPFTDYFPLSVPAGVQILNDVSKATTGYIVANKVSATEFTTGCQGDIVNSGTVTAVIGSDSNTQCTLVIEDGGDEMNPSVVSSDCKGGMQFHGVDHDYGSYTYTLKFSN